MRGLRMMMAAIACAGSMVAAHGQIGGDEPGSKSTEGTAAPTSRPTRVRISSGVLAGLNLTKVQPEYPEQARRDGIQGAVTLHVIIGKDGHIATIEVISGPADLKEAAVNAVKQWTYKPFLLNDQPVEVDSTVIVNFNLTGG